MVLEDSRVDQYPKLVKGESKVVWEWQGTRHVRLLITVLEQGFEQSLSYACLGSYRFNTAACL